MASACLRKSRRASSSVWSSSPTRSGRADPPYLIGPASMAAHRLVLALSMAIAACPAAALADAEAPRAPRAVALGFNLDLFPTVISAVNGKVGIAPQVWVGLEPVRLRFVGAHLEPPDALAFADKGFVHPTTTAFAAIVD